MTLLKKRFAQLLTEGIHRIRLREHKTVQIVQDELGYSIGREGGSAIEYWRKGHLPTSVFEIETLATEMVRRAKLERVWLEDFLACADYPNSDALLMALFPAVANDAVVAGRQNQVEAVLTSPDQLPPFVIGPPITHPYQFFGRTRILRRLFNLWQQPPLQNAALIGPRRSGKTSLLHYLKTITTAPKDHLRPEQKNDWLPQPQSRGWVFIDFQDSRLGTRSGLMRYILNALNLKIPEPFNLDRFLDVLSEGIKQPTVLLLDEIGVALARYPELDDLFWESLRSVATNQVEGKLGFVLTSHAPPDQLAQQSNMGSPFFNIFGYAAHLGPLTDAEAQVLVTSIMASRIGKPIAESDLAWLLHESQGWPILLQILAREYQFALEDMEDGEIDDAWREDGLAQIEPYRYLLTQ
ncbi:MAG: ATP-binding protein [Chloroflexota bacterium]